MDTLFALSTEKTATALNRWGACLLIAVGGLLISAFLFQLTLSHEIDLQRSTFDRIATDRIHSLEFGIQSDLTYLDALGGLEATSDEMRRSEFRSFVDFLQPANTVKALEWIPRVGSEQRAEVEALAQADGVENFQFLEMGPEGILVRARLRGEYFPVLFVEPLEGNEAAIGFDLASNPARLEALQTARDTGRPIATERISLVQLNSSHGGFLVFSPTYRADQPIETTQQRQENLTGFVLGVFNIDDLVRAGIPENGEAKHSIAIEIIDLAAVEGNRRLYSDNGGLATPDAPSLALLMSEIISVGGREWQITATPANSLAFRLIFWKPAGVLTLAVLITGLCIFLVETLRMRQERVEKLVFEGTNSLRQVKAELVSVVEDQEATLEAVSDAILAIDSSGLILKANESTSTIFGYAADEMIGKNVSMLMPSSQALHHDGYLAKSKKHNVTRIAGERRQLEGLRADGSTFPVDLTINAFESDGTKKFVGILRDVTHEKAQSDQLQEALDGVNEANVGLQDANERIQEEAQRYIELGEMAEKHKRAAERAASRFETLACNAPYPIGIVAKDSGIILYANQHIEDVLALKPGEKHTLFGGRFIARQEDRGKLKEKFVKDGQVVDEEFLLRSPTIGDFWALTTIISIEFESQDCFYICINDVTERKENEQSLLQMTENLELKATDLESLTDSLRLERREATALKESAEAKAMEERALAQLLSLGMKTSPMDEFLGSSLELLLRTVPWLGILPQGGIFITEQDGNVDRLTLKASQGFAPELHSKCAHVPMGHCLCGRAAQSQEVVHADCVDERHEVQFEGMKPHGHYNVPMLDDGRTMGVIVFYLPEGYERKEEEVEFLKRVATVVAMGLMRRKVDQELVAAKELADEANRSKSEFLASMSHEIRTPMNGVLGMAELMLMSELPDETRENIGIIQESGKALLGILNDILDLSKIEAGKVELELLEADLVATIGSVSSLVRDQIEDDGLDYRETLPQGLISPIVMGDVTRIRQVLANLISNAKKFTHKGGIEVVLSQRTLDDGKVESKFEVKDTGIGLSEDQRARIFEAFNQADQSTTREYGGTGLGLSISRQLAELMGGELGVVSSLGKGSTFWFTIVSQPVQRVISESEFAAEEEPVAPEEPALGLPCLLVAEDNLVNQKIISKTLAAFGFEFVMVGNGQLAFDAVTEGSFDMVLMDINMPVLDGIGATKLIRSLSSEKSQIPIIALTANAMNGDQEKYLAAGMNGYVSKPISPAQILEVITQHAGNSSGGAPSHTANKALGL